MAVKTISSVLFVASVLFRVEGFETALFLSGEFNLAAEGTVEFGRVRNAG